MFKPIANFKGYKKISNLKFFQLNFSRFNGLKFPRQGFWSKLSGLKQSFFYPPLYVLFFGLITSAVVLGVTTFWQNNLAPVAYTTDNLTAENQEGWTVTYVGPSAEENPAAAAPPSQAAGQAAEGPPAEEAEAAALSAEPALHAMVRPLEGKAEQGYGFAYSQVHEDYRLHPGVDIMAQKGSKVVAVLEGAVEEIRLLPGGGTQVTVKHGSGWQSVYQALDTELAKGDWVKKGDTLGRLYGKVPGETDLGSHLHFELRHNGEAIDPATYISF